MANKKVDVNTKYHRFSFTVAVNPGEQEALEMLEKEVGTKAEEIFNAVEKHLSHAPIVFNRQEVSWVEFSQDNDYEDFDIRGQEI